MTPQDFIDEWQSGCEYIIAHTSGSTGQPKEIHLPRKIVEDSARRSIAHFNLNSDSHLHLCLSPDYIAGKMVIVRALLSGATLSWEKPSSSPLAGDTVPSEITLLSVVAAQVPGLVALKKEGRLPLIKHLLIGGAPLDTRMASEALNVAERVWESYGMTETASHIALREVSLKNEPAYFRPLPGIEIGKDTRGCLTIKLPGCSELITNDIVELSPDGSFHICGRIDNVIITGGCKVHPEQVERKLQSLLPPTPAWYISSEPDEKWGSRVVLVIESEDLSAEESERILRAFHNLLPPHERPRKIILLLKIPRTSTGKLRRQSF